MRLFKGRKPKDPNVEKAKDGSSSSGPNSSGSLTSRPKRGKQMLSSKTTKNSNVSVFRVQVPEGIKEGEEFQVYAGEKVVRVTCPPGTTPGKFLSITVPKEPQDALPPDSPGVTKVDEPGNHNGPDAYMVEIPVGIRGGQTFPVTIRGQSLVVTCPPNAEPGMRVRVVPPPPDESSSNAAAALSTRDGPSSSSSLSSAPLSGGSGARPPVRRTKSKDDDTQVFEVVVPSYVRPGQAFALLAGGIRVLVSCPLNASPGQRIRFKLPLALTQQPKDTSATHAQRLKYDKDGWSRTVRLSDQKFQWVRMDERGGIDESHLQASRFDPEKSAFCRRLQFVEGSDVRIRDGILELVSAHEAACESKVRNERGDTVVSYTDIAEAQVRTFDDKVLWFSDKCNQLAVDWNEGHMRINVRREHLLEDSVDAVMSLSRRDMRKLWRFEFIGEDGLDAGGLKREWFHLVTSEIFDPDMGFWLPSETNQMCMEINPASRLIHNDYLVYYRFLGRIMGKALFDQQIVAGHMAQFIYKHMLGWPMTFKDLKAYDEGYYMSLKQIQQLAETGEDVEMILCMDFTTTVEMMGLKEEIELIENGADVAVTNDNYPEYMEVCLKYRMLERVKPQLNELLLGFFDVIPEPLLTIFDFQELELLMCGLPTIDMDDWMANTEYSGDYEHCGADYPSVQWFWEVVSGLDQEMKARLLQFVTGTSGVPSRGFGVLQGNDGNIRRFTIHGLPVGVCLYPRAHTCFNRIDLPMYETKEDLEEKLKLAITMAATGFDIE